MKMDEGDTTGSDFELLAKDVQGSFDWSSNKPYDSGQWHLVWGYWEA